MLSFAEVCRQEKTFNFAASTSGDTWVYAWVHKRGALDKGSSDGGHDLVVMTHGGFPQVVISGAKSLSTPSFDGERFVVAKDRTEAVIGSVTSLQVRTWFTLPAGETFDGAPTFEGDEVLFATSGGTPKRSRLHAIASPVADQAAAAGSADTAAAPRRTLFTAEHGGGVLSWDRAPVAPHNVLVVHRLANAMLAELVLLTASGDGAAATVTPRVLALDGRVEYCRPQAAFLADGRVVARLNLSSGEAKVGGMPRQVTHGLWLLDLKGLATAPVAAPMEWAPLQLQVNFGGKKSWGPESVDEHGTYDACSTSYGNGHGVREGFVLDPARQRMALTARPHDPARGMSDRLYLVDFEKGPEHANIQQKGCYVPVALAEGGELVYHFRSPTEAGDLWKCTTHASLDARSETSADRLTHTMPPALRAKLSAPEELVVGGRHALLFRPPPDTSGAPKPGLVWAHGGPMTAVGFDYNPIAAWCVQRGRYLIAWLWPPGPGPLYPRCGRAPAVSDGSDGSIKALHRRPAVLILRRRSHRVWPCTRPGYSLPHSLRLASLGYFVCIPNFAGSTGFGIPLMDSVLGDGCGVADLADCVTCASFLRTLDGVDTRRGVAIAGHSWGGYLALRALTAPSAKDAFACGIASAGISDWFCQQRHTEVRYYDYALMGGWVYEKEVKPRAKEASPLTHAAQLQAPLLVLHGEDDIDVPFAQARAFVEAARSSRSSLDPSAPALELVSFAGEGHGMGGWKPATQVDALRRMSEFLRIHLQPWDFTDNPHGDLTAY